MFDGNAIGSMAALTKLTRGGRNDETLLQFAKPKTEVSQLAWRIAFLERHPLDLSSTKRQLYPLRSSIVAVWAANALWKTRDRTVLLEAFQRAKLIGRQLERLAHGRN